MSARAVDGAALKRIRLERKWWTQEELAEASGVNRTTISDLESGKRKMARRGTIRALARALQCSPEELLDTPLGRASQREAHQDALRLG